MKDKNFKLKTTVESGNKTLWLQFTSKGGGGSINLNNLSNEKKGITQIIIQDAIYEYFCSSLEEEPIQTEYERKKERFGLLKSSNCMAGSPEDQEIKDLDAWLRKNKQKNWLTCTRENTKVGSEVRYKNSKRLLEVEHIYRDNDFCSVWDIEVETTITNLKLDYLEIDMGDRE